MWNCEKCGILLNPPKIQCPICKSNTGISSSIVASSEDEKFLEIRYRNCIKSCDNVKKKHLIKYMKIIKDNLSISINLHSGSLINFLQNERVPYTNLHDNVRAKVSYNPELIAKRKGIDNLLFGKDCENLIYGALNLGNKGLISYGSACIFLKVDNDLKKRVSFLENNSFNFLSSSSKGISLTIPNGIRALWHTVHKLAIVKHNNDFQNKRKMTHKQLANLILFSDGDKKNDIFIESQILQPLTRSSISRIIYSPSHDRQINAKGLIGRIEEHNRNVLIDLAKYNGKVISSQVKLFLPEATFEVVK